MIPFLASLAFIVLASLAMDPPPARRARTHKPRVYKVTDLRTGHVCTRGQAGAASSKATVARLDKVIGAEIESRRDMWGDFRGVYRPAFQAVVIRNPELLPTLVGRRRDKGVQHAAQSYRRAVG